MPGFVGDETCVFRAWWGDPAQSWSPKRGADVTRQVQDAVARHGKVEANIAALGDPLEGVRKVLLVEVEKGSDLFCPGQVVWVYRDHGSLMPLWFRRIWLRFGGSSLTSECSRIMLGSNTTRRCSPSGST